MINTLLDYNHDLFTVYNYNSKIRFGNNLDGGYVIGELCADYDCYISAGLADNDDFSIDFIDKYKIDIKNCFGFDGTIKNMPSNLTNKMTFVQKNIGFNNNNNTSNLTDIIETHNNIFLKMDIEGGEWEWLLAMDENKLIKFSQIVIELHGLTSQSWHYQMTMNNFNCSSNDKILGLKKLEKTFYLIHAHGNNADNVASNGMPNVIELTYINKKFFNEKPELNFKSLPSSLDLPNEKRCPDVNLNFAPFVFVKKTAAPSSQYWVSFDNNCGRFGNQLFRYVTCKLFTFKFGHKYICKSQINTDDYVIVTEENILSVLNNSECANKNVLCIGYFQICDLFKDYQTQLIHLIYDYNSNDYWEDERLNKYYIKDYLITNNHNIELNSNDIVIHLRLDDFIQYPGKTSDIIPPQYYTELLEKMKKDSQKVYIICDKIKYDWEFKYLEFFKKWNPRLIQDTLKSDIALMRDSKILLHSNSSLCWIVSYLSNKTQRIIPSTNFCKTQKLHKISENDIFQNVTPLDHDEVHNLNAYEDTIFPLSFYIPDECVVKSVPDKKSLLASLIPGDLSTYIFNENQEKEYNEMYRESRFAITKMKGGWDCLRHYEILMNGCIPLFENLENCPTNTLTTYPKELNNEAYDLYNNWSETTENLEKYKILSNKFLEHTKQNCTTSKAVKYFLSKIKNGDKVKNILLITCHSGINYNRESLWIGLKRYIESINGVTAEYEKIPFLYDDCNLSTESYSNAFTIPKRLKKEQYTDISNEEIIEKINNNFWDLIIYGKVGPDEFCTFPLYDIVKQKYNKNKIAFIFGGDEIFNLKITNKTSYHTNMFNRYIYYYPYTEYLNYYKQYGMCFVRELDK